MDRTYEMEVSVVLLAEDYPLIKQICDALQKKWPFDVEEVFELSLVDDTDDLDEELCPSDEELEVIDNESESTGQTELTGESKELKLKLKPILGYVLDGVNRFNVGETDDDNRMILRLSGIGWLMEGKNESEFAKEIAEEIWKIANGNRFVCVKSTYLGVTPPFEFHMFDTAEYEQFKKETEKQSPPPEPDQNENK